MSTEQIAAAGPFPGKQCTANGRRHAFRDYVTESTTQMTGERWCGKEPVIALRTGAMLCRGCLVLKLADLRTVIDGAETTLLYLKDVEQQCIAVLAALAPEPPR